VRPNDTLTSRAIILTGAVATALALYFLLSLYVFPQSYQTAPRRPEAVVTNISLSAHELKLGETFVLSVNGTNRGEEADMQIVSVGFPNFTRTDNVKVLRHSFAQAPFIINAGDPVGSEYSGNARQVRAQHAAIEAFSRPWPSGNIYGINLQVKPEKEGTFIIYVKSVAFPHSWDGAHWPRLGVTDYQKEFVEVYYVQVTKP
jgi:hypothetical protein